jgi:hypothetical protein
MEEQMARQSATSAVLKLSSTWDGQAAEEVRHTRMVSSRPQSELAVSSSHTYRMDTSQP